jgi:hypothetical protein
MDPETPPTVSDPPTPDDLDNLRLWSLMRRDNLVAQADSAVAVVIANRRLAEEARASWQHRTYPPPETYA